jgi:protein SCO1
MAKRTRIALLAAVTVLVAALAVVVIVAEPSSPGGKTSSTGRPDLRPGSGSSPEGSGFDGAALPPGVKARPFTLTALASPSGAASTGGGDGTASDGTASDGTASSGTNDEGVSLGRFAGKVVVMAFLYPGCGHTCTLVADQIRGALDELGREPAVVIVDASQKAGTRARTRVLRFFEETGLAGRAYYLTGSRRQLQAVWHAYGVVSANAGKAKFDDYVQVLLIDGEGYERVLFGAEDLAAESLAHDIGKLQAG